MEFSIDSVISQPSTITVEIGRGFRCPGWVRDDHFLVLDLRLAVEGSQERVFLPEKLRELGVSEPFIKAAQGFPHPGFLLVPPTMWDDRL